METDIFHQEILMIIPAFQKELCERNNCKEFRYKSNQEQLEEACWNGLLDELLEGIIVKSGSGKRLCIWEIQRGRTFLAVQLCYSPVIVDKKLSIDPYYFLPMLGQN